MMDRHRLHSLVLFVILLLSPSVFAYKLSPDNGQADIGAYHVQPGRCEGVERRLGRKKYDYFIHSPPFMTSFDSIISADPNVPPEELDGAGSGVEAMDATSMCAFNPELTEGYGGGFDKMKLYLVYSRCIYGTDDMRVLCGTTNGRGRPTKMYNLVQATCPSGTKCKNLCATMRDPSLTSPFAAKQVQLAQCMPMVQWQKLTDMYRPKPAAPEAAQIPGSGEGSSGKANQIDPTVKDNSPNTNPTQTQADKDGTIPGRVLTPVVPGVKPDVPGTGSDATTPKTPDIPHEPKPGDPVHTVSHLQDGLVKPKVVNPQPSTPAPKGDVSAASTRTDPPVQPIPAKAPAQPKEQPQTPQKAPTDMGFRKRDLHKTITKTHSLHRRHARHLRV